MSFLEEEQTPALAENAYDDAMAKLNASLQRSASVRGSGLSLGGGSYAGSSLGGVDEGPPNYVYGVNSNSAAQANKAFLQDVDVDYDEGDQLPSIEEARTTAASTLSRVERSYHDSPRSQRQSTGFPYADAENNIDGYGDKSYGPGHNSRRNWYKVAFFVLTAAIIGTVIGIAVGFTAGKEVEKLEEQGGNQGGGGVVTTPTDAPRPTTAPAPNSPPTPPAPTPTLPPPTPVTAVPTPAPTITSRINPVMDWLVNANVADSTTLGDTTSPQFLAAQWIADTDPAKLSLPTVVGQDDEFIFIERYVLAVFYHMLKGSDWSYSFKFFSIDSVCDWNVDVTLPDKRKLSIGIVCDAQGHVVSINIPQNNLIGSLATELGLLTNLNFLALNHNILDGTLPLSMGDLTKLTYLALHYNELEGTLPLWLGQFSTLRVLGMGDNNFKGALPNTLSNLHDTLETLGFDNNELTGGLDPMYTLTNLERIYLEENQFQQALDDVPWASFTSLTEVDLSGNSLGGSLPAALVHLAKLQILDLGDNNIAGTLPDFDGAAAKLRYLALYNNGFTQSIPSSIANLNNLTHLDLSDNSLTGKIPHQMSSLNVLEYMFLANNGKLQIGAIPTFLGELTTLTDLSLKGTQRAAGIPTNMFSKLSNLVLLELDSNDLTGEIPSEIGTLDKLTYLLLNHNDLTGTVPKEIQLLPQLEILLVGRNQITGNLDSMCNDRARKPEIAGADCAGDSPQTACACCNICCQEGVNATECRDRVYFGQLDPVWQDSYQRRFYQFADQDFGQPMLTKPTDPSELSSGGEKPPVNEDVGDNDSLGTGGGAAATNYTDGSEDGMPNGANR